MQPLDRGPMSPTNEKLDQILLELFTLNINLRRMAEAEQRETPAPVIQVTSPDVDLSPLLAALNQPQEQLDPAALVEALKAVRDDGRSDEAVIEALSLLRKELQDLGTGMRAIAGGASGGGGGTVFLQDNPARLLGHVTVDSMPPVTVDTTLLAKDATLTNGTQTTQVSNFPATQTVSGSVSVSNLPATQPVSATSLPLPTGAATETTLSAVAKDATFAKDADGGIKTHVQNFPATQPVSAASLPLPSGAATSAKQPALGTAGAQSADVITVQGDPSGTPQPVSGTVSVNSLPAGSAKIGSVARMIDGARTRVSLTYTSSTPAVADTLLTVTLNKGGTTSSVTTVPVTSGKVLRITSIALGLRATVATLPFGMLTLRINDTGAAVLGSNAVMYVPVSGNAAAIGNTGTTTVGVEDGLELSGAAQLGISFSNNLITNVANIALIGYEYTP